MDNENELLSFNGSRQVYRVLVMYYQDGRKQSEIAAATGLSVTTVNRMIRQGWENGMVEITITSPFLSAHQLEKDLAPARKYQVEVVPALGCVQGKHYTDVNHVASEMAAAPGKSMRRCLPTRRRSGNG